MRIETLKVFCDLVETESFSEAAERSGVTQSAVSQKISSLEKDYGVVLLERGKKHFRLTPEGRVFLEAAQGILKIHRGIGTRFEELQNRVAGALRLATVHSAGLHELPAHFREFRTLFPEVDLDISYRRLNQVYSDVLEGSADLGFVAYPQERKGLVLEVSWRDRLVLICSPEHEFAARRTVRLKDLSGESFVSFEPDLPTRNALVALFKKEGVAVKEAMEFDDVATVKRAVEVERAVSLVPLKSVTQEVEANTLRVVDVESDELWRPLGLMRKRTRAVSPAMREFIGLLREREEIQG